MRRISEIIKNILLFILICSVLFVSLEIIYRRYKYFKYNKDIKNLSDSLIHPLGPKDRLEYVYKPHSQFTLKNGIIYKINSRGLRDREFDYSRSQGVYRILALGDSYTFGWGEALKNSYPKILERILNQNPNLKWEVINAGVYGYNTEQEYEFLRREGIKYYPDMVILGFVINDAEPQHTIPRSPYLEMNGVRFWFLEFVKYRINIFLLDRFNIDEFFILKRKEYRYHTWEGFIKKEFNWKKENCLNALKNIKKILDKEKIQLSVVIFPSFEYGTPSYKKYRYKIVNDLVADFCKTENINCLDIYPFFEGKKITDVIQNSGHLNKNGYLIVANAVFNHIKKIPFRHLQKVGY